jgi:hypothetical protein
MSRPISLLLGILFYALVLASPTLTHAQELSRDTQSSATTSSLTCPTGSVVKTMSGSYRLVPSDPYSPRTYYEVRYCLSSSGAVTNIQERARATSEDGLPMTWSRSCSNGASSCVSRSIALTSTFGSWRTGAPNARSGQEYRHYTSGGGLVAYGYTYFAKP